MTHRARVVPLSCLFCAFLPACGGAPGPLATVSPAGPDTATTADGSVFDSTVAEDRAAAEALTGVAVEEAPSDEPLPSDTARVPVNEADVNAELSRLFGPEAVREAGAGEAATHGAPLEVRWDIPIEINERVERWLAYFQTEARERFELWLVRSGRYEEFMRQEFRSAGLPEDLVYLSLIESGFSPRAYSRARAVGLWQFIASTARRYGLKVNYWVDERRDPVASTRAAVQHLRDLYEMFGSWYLAAAAYNAGAGRVERAIRRKRSDDFWDLAGTRLLRSETRNYVPKLIAAALIAKQPSKYGFANIQYFDPIAFEEVEVPDATSLDVVAEAAGVSPDDIETLNPHVLRGITPPGRPYTLRVPAGTRDSFVVRYTRIPAQERVTWVTHEVRRGETLGVIARRYGVTVEAIRAANRGVSPRRLQIGQVLLIPRARAFPATSRRGASAGSRPVPIAYHRVRAGETLWEISRRYGVSVADLLEWNGLRTRTIRAGRRLRVGPPSSAGEVREITHRVQRGDTVWAIAQRYSVRPADLLKWNNLDRDAVLRPGDDLKVLLR